MNLENLECQRLMIAIVLFKLNDSPLESDMDAWMVFQDIRELFYDSEYFDEVQHLDASDKIFTYLENLKSAQPSTDLTRLEKASYLTLLCVNMENNALCTNQSFEETFKDTAVSFFAEVVLNMRDQESFINAVIRTANEKLPLNASQIIARSVVSNDYTPFFIPSLMLTRVQRDHSRNLKVLREQTSEEERTLRKRYNEIVVADQLIERTVKAVKIQSRTKEALSLK